MPFDTEIRLYKKTIDELATTSWALKAHGFNTCSRNFNVAITALANCIELLEALEKVCDGD